MKNETRNAQIKRELGLMGIVVKDGVLTIPAGVHTCQYPLNEYINMFVNMHDGVVKQIICDGAKFIIPASLLPLRASSYDSFVDIAKMNDLRIPYDLRNIECSHRPFSISCSFGE